MATDIPPVLGVTPASLTGVACGNCPFLMLFFSSSNCSVSKHCGRTYHSPEWNGMMPPCHPSRTAGHSGSPGHPSSPHTSPEALPTTPPEALSSLASRGPLLQAPFLNPTTLHLHSVPPVPWLTSEGYVQPLRSPAKPTHSHPQLIYCLLTTSTEPLARPQFRTSGFHCPRQVPLEPQNQHVPKC